MKILKTGFILFTLLLSIQTVFATSGACSNHGGVYCSRGPDSDGSVVCNDGWKDSSVGYYEMKECNNSCPFYVRKKTYDEYKNYLEDKIQEVKNGNQDLCNSIYQDHLVMIQENYDSCVKNMQSITQNIAIMGGSSSLLTNQNDCENKKASQTNLYESQKQSCLNSSNDTIFKYQDLLNCMILDETDYCPALYLNTHSVDGKCYCNDGFVNKDEKCIPKEEYEKYQQALKNTQELEEKVRKTQECQKINGKNSSFDDNTGKCSCFEGYLLDNKNQCVRKQTIVVKDIKVEESPKEEEKASIETSRPIQESIDAPQQTKEAMEIKNPVEKSSLLKRVKNWIINLF